MKADPEREDDIQRPRSSRQPQRLTEKSSREIVAGVDLSVRSPSIQIAAP